MRAFGRDLIRGGHYGQRSCEPRQQAEHMAAPTNAAKREESSCQLGAVHTWHKADLTFTRMNVRFRGKSRHRNSRATRPLMTQSGIPSKVDRAAERSLCIKYLTYFGR